VRQQRAPRFPLPVPPCATRKRAHGRAPSRCPASLLGEEEIHLRQHLSHSIPSHLSISRDREPTLKRSNPAGPRQRCWPRAWN
jgi:hypothetical protein